MPSPLSNLELHKEPSGYAFGHPELHHASAEVDGIFLHFVEGGTGPLVLFVAGFPQSCYAWRRVLPLLVDSFRVIALDLPGQGDSDAPSEGYDTDTTARRVMAFMNTLSMEPKVYVGHDIGAWVGYSLAAQFPEHLRGVVLIDGNIPGITLETTITIGPNDWRSWHFLFNRLHELPELLLEGREKLLLNWFFHNKAMDFSKAFTAHDLDEYERVYKKPEVLRAMLGYYRAIPEDLVLNQQWAQTKLQPPVLAVVADNGSAPNLFEKLKPLGQSVYGHTIQNSGHYIPEEQPAALAEAIRCFINAL